MTHVNDWNRQIISQFRANGGKVGYPFANSTLLLLHHQGAKSGQARVSPLIYQSLGPNRYAIFASKSGAPTNPGWYYNLLANPHVTIEVGAETLSVQARVAQGEERDQIWSRQKEHVPMYAEYEKKTTRLIPVIILETMTADTGSGEPH